MTEDQLSRYSRHLLLPAFGEEKQGLLLSSRVLVVGAGGLGSAALEYLAAAGVGTLGIVDADVVSLSNLQRQIIHSTSDVGRLKTLSAKEKILALSPEVRVETYDFLLSEDNAKQIISAYDFVVDATDNFSAKYLINDVCVKARKPFCIGGVQEFSGQLITWVEGAADYRCWFEPSLEPQERAILGPVPGVLGSLEAIECIKFLTNQGELLTNRMLCFDALKMEFNIITL